jgi:hypothetical protein
VPVGHGRGAALLIRRVALLLTLLLCAAAPAWAAPPGLMTVAEFRAFLAAIEEKYDAQAARAVAVFFALGAATHEYLASDCLRGQTVAGLREWIRDSAPPELTLQQALRLNAKEHGCEPRAQADADAELAIRSGQWR